MPFFAKRRTREADVDAAIKQHDDEDDDFTKFLDEFEKVKASNRDLRARLRAQQRETRKWRHRCLVLTGRYRLPRVDYVIRSL